MTIAVRDCAMPGDIAYASHQTRAVERWHQGKHIPALDQVAQEVPVAMVYNGISHAVMLATPASLEAFALGFSLAEGILQHRGELYELEIVPGREGIELQMTIAQERFAALKQRRRTLAGRTGCGICGAESLQQVTRPTGQVISDLRFTSATVHAALQQLPERQSLQSLTGAAHAAAWATADGTVHLLEEDIGRHNALDKLIGRLAHNHTLPQQGYAIVTSRASYEMVLKVATMGIPMLVAISAPTSFAIELAQRAGITLAGFARETGHVLYSHPQRFIE